MRFVIILIKARIFGQEWHTDFSALHGGKRKGVVEQLAVTNYCVINVTYEHLFNWSCHPRMSSFT